MNDEKIKSLQAHLQEINNRLANPIPAKHKGHPATYKAFLANDLRITTNKLNELKGV